jgi:hypothetical protein
MQPWLKHWKVFAVGLVVEAIGLYTRSVVLILAGGGIVFAACWLGAKKL